MLFIGGPNNRIDTAGRIEETLFRAQPTPVAPIKQDGPSPVKQDKVCRFIKKIKGPRL